MYIPLRTPKLIPNTIYTNIMNHVFLNNLKKMHGYRVSNVYCVCNWDISPYSTVITYYSYFLYS